MSWITISLASSFLSGILTYIFTKSWKISLISSIIVFIIILLNNPKRRFMKAFWATFSLFATLNSFYFNVAGKISNTNFQLANNNISDTLSISLIVLSMFLLYLDYLERKKISDPISHYEKNNIIGNFILGNFIINRTISKKIESKNQLIEILNFRADEINKNLSSNFDYLEIENFLLEFNNLHKKHICAIEAENYLLAHEIIRKIHKLSYEMEQKEFSIDHKKNRPNVFYNLMQGAFTRGSLICKYIVNDMNEYSKKYPVNFSSFDSQIDRKSKNEIIKFYNFILEIT